MKKKHVLINLLCLFLVSCFQNTNKGIVVLSCNASETSKERCAVPSCINDFSEYKWSCTFKNTVTGEEKVFSIEDESLFYGVSFSLMEGNWNIQINGYLNEELVYTTKSASLEITTGGYYKLELQLYYIEEGFGTVQLEMDTGNSQITKVLIQDTNSKLDNSYLVDENGIIHIYQEKVTAGDYSGKISFFSDDVYLLSIPETFNVRNHTVTNCWNNNWQLNENKLELSKEWLNQFTGKDFIVFGIESENYDFKNQNILDIIKKIHILNDGNSTYRIFVKGEIKDFRNNPYSSENKEAFINLDSPIPLKLEICGLNNSPSENIINANRTENNPGRILYLGNKVQLCLRNITLCNGYSLSEGGGIYVEGEKPERENEYNLIIAGNSKITNNTAVSSGGGIFLKEGKILLKEGASVSQNYAFSKGGGICVYGLSIKENRVLDVENGYLSENVALSSSGKEGGGGGLYCQFGFVNITDSFVQGNRAANGGGIDIAQNSIVKITDTLIQNNAAIYEKGRGGGGVFASGVSAKLYLQSGTKITSNNSASTNYIGGGIYLSSTELLIFDGVEIMGNFVSLVSGNLSFKSGKTVTIGEKLSHTQIGLSPIDLEQDSVFTKNYGKFNINSPDHFFFADNDSISIMQNENLEAVIKK